MAFDLSSSIESIKSGIESGVSSLGGAAEDVKQALENVVSGETWNTITQSWESFKSDTLFWIVVGIVALVLILTIFDGLRNAIKGLDVSLLGAVFVWLSVKIPDVVFLSDLKEPCLILGVALIAVGIVIFVFTKIWRSRKKRRAARKAVREYEG